MSASLFVAERRRAILEKLKANGRVAVKDLSAEMQVSGVTIRQDLRALEDKGLLERTYGGAVTRQSTATFQSELSFDLRSTKNREAKTAIGAAAAALIQEGHSIALDASTTAYALVPHLKQFNRLTIVTNNLIIAQNFQDKPGIEIFIPGGRYKKETFSIVGQPQALPDINLNIGIIGAGAISLNDGISDLDADEVHMKQLMIARCAQPVIVVDGSKWGQVAPYTVLPSKQIQQIITTSDAPMHHVEAFRRQGTTVHLISLQTS